MDQRVVDERARAEARLECGGDRLRRGPSMVAVGILEAGKCHVERLLVAVKRHTQGGHELAEQSVPGALAGNRLLGQDLLLRLGEQVRPVAAGASQVMAA